jgi:hypothetical protein
MAPPGWLVVGIGRKKSAIMWLMSSSEQVDSPSECGRWADWGGGTACARVVAAVAVGVLLAMGRRVVRYCGIREGGGGSRRDVRRPPPVLLVVESSFSKGRGDRAVACLYSCADLRSCDGSLSSLCSSSGWVGNNCGMRWCEWVDLEPIVVELIALLNCCCCCCCCWSLPSS